MGVISVIVLTILFFRIYYAFDMIDAFENIPDVRVLKDNGFLKIILPRHVTKGKFTLSLQIDDLKANKKQNIYADCYFQGLKYFCRYYKAGGIYNDRLNKYKRVKRISLNELSNNQLLLKVQELQKTAQNLLKQINLRKGHLMNKDFKYENLIRMYKNFGSIRNRNSINKDNIDLNNYLINDNEYEPLFNETHVTIMTPKVLNYNTEKELNELFDNKRNYYMIKNTPIPNLSMQSSVINNQYHNPPKYEPENIALKQLFLNDDFFEPELKDSQLKNNQIVSIRPIQSFSSDQKSELNILERPKNILMDNYKFQRQRSVNENDLKSQDYLVLQPVSMNVFSDQRELDKDFKDQNKLFNRNEPFELNSIKNNFENYLDNLKPSQIKLKENIIPDNEIRIVLDNNQFETPVYQQKKFSIIPMKTKALRGTLNRNETKLMLFKYLLEKIKNEVQNSKVSNNKFNLDKNLKLKLFTVRSSNQNPNFINPYYFSFANQLYLNQLNKDGIPMKLLYKPVLLI